MNVLLITDVLVVEFVTIDVLLIMCSPQEGDEVALEVVAEALDIFARILADCLDCAYMFLALNMTFEAISVSALLFAGLTVPSESLTIVSVSSRILDSRSHTWRPFDLLLFAMSFVLPNSAFGIVTVG